MHLKLIMENWRRTLREAMVLEGAKTVDDFVKNKYSIDLEQRARGIKFVLSDLEGKMVGFIEILSVKAFGLHVWRDEQNAIMRSKFFQTRFKRWAKKMEEFYDSSDDPDEREDILEDMMFDFWEEEFLDYIDSLNCLGAWTIGGVETLENGWGPFLYDIAIEYATIQASGLTPGDKVGGVSEEAYPVWEYYFSKRDDVKKVQLDDFANTLTTTKADNCTQGGSIVYSKEFGKPEFPNNPLNFVYQKEPVLLKHLGLLRDK